MLVGLRPLVALGVFRPSFSKVGPLPLVPSVIARATQPPTRGLDRFSSGPSVPGARPARAARGISWGEPPPALLRRRSPSPSSLGSKVRTWPMSGHCAEMGRSEEAARGVIPEITAAGGTWGAYAPGTFPCTGRRYLLHFATFSTIWGIFEHEASILVRNMVQEIALR